MKNGLFFSIVIPTLNEAKYLPHLLTDLSLQTYKDFEVIHIDGKSDDKTVEIASKFNVISKIVNVRNVSYQRNAGAKLAKGKWIIFMDADNRIKDSFLEKIRSKLVVNKSIDLFTTLVKIDENEMIEKMTNFWLLFHDKFENKAVFGSLIGVKTVFAKKFPFDEKQKLMEDVIFVQNIINKGYIFKIFKYPRYLLSLRRIKSNGIPKTIKIIFRSSYNYYINGKDFKNDNFDYEMNGGTIYSNNE
ncbi:glycosyltransferase [Patescibacteria group bacterium]|nr:glycosyltransferase [Patescibacteria group bacterium]